MKSLNDHSLMELIGTEKEKKIKYLFFYYIRLLLKVEKGHTDRHLENE